MRDSRPFIFIGIGGFLLICLIAGLTIKPANPASNSTTIDSSFSKLSISAAVNGTGGGAPADSAVNGQFMVFGLSKLSLPAGVKTNLEQNLADALSTTIQPTADATYIQIDTSTIRCADQYDCAFSFYLDSPERYFSYHAYYKPDGSQAYTLQELPLAGVNQ